MKFAILLHFGWFVKTKSPLDHWQAVSMDQFFSFFVKPIKIHGNIEKPSIDIDKLQISSTRAIHTLLSIRVNIWYAFEVDWVCVVFGGDMFDKHGQKLDDVFADFDVSRFSCTNTDEIHQQSKAFLGFNRILLNVFI